MVATDFAIRHCGFPALALWQNVQPSCKVLIVHEDNQAMIRVIETGKNPTMHDLHRTHRVSVAWLHEVFSEDQLRLVYEVSAKMCADIFTKGFTEKTSWEAACLLINHIDADKFDQVLKRITSDADQPPSSKKKGGKLEVGDDGSYYPHFQAGGLKRTRVRRKRRNAPNQHRPFPSTPPVAAGMSPRLLLAAATMLSQPKKRRLKKAMPSCLAMSTMTNCSRA